MFEFLFAPQEMGRPFFAPPDVPADRVKALREAFEKTLKDPAYLAEAERMGMRSSTAAARMSTRCWSGCMPPRKP